MVERLRGRIDLVVVLGSGKTCQLADVVCQPRRGAGKEYLTIFESHRLSIEAHELIGAAWRRIWFNSALSDSLQFLNQLGTRGFVLDQDDARIVLLRLCQNPALQIRVVQPLPNHIEEIV